MVWITLIGAAFAQTTTAASGTEPWYTDPRWWGILLSGGIGLAGLIWGRLDKFEEARRRREDEKKRQAERKEDLARQEHQQEIDKLFAPAIQALRVIDELVEATQIAMNSPLEKDRCEKICQIQAKEFPKTFSTLGRQLQIIDKRLRKIGLEHRLSRRTGDILGEIQSRLDTLRNNDATTERAREAFNAIEEIYRSLFEEVHVAATELRQRRPSGIDRLTQRGPLSSSESSPDQ
jgi:hypothetical protein